MINDKQFKQLTTLADQVLASIEKKAKRGNFHTIDLTIVVCAVIESLIKSSDADVYKEWVANKDALVSAFQSQISKGK